MAGISNIQIVQGVGCSCYTAICSCYTAICSCYTAFGSCYTAFRPCYTAPIFKISTRHGQFLVQAAPEGAASRK